MRVYTDGVNTVVAADEADARAVLADYTDEGSTSELREVDPARELSIYEDGVSLRHGERCEACGFGSATSMNGHQRGCRVGCPTKTAAQWAADNGRSFLCSTEQ